MTTYNIDLASIPRVLHRFKQGKPTERITVLLTYTNVHAIWSDNTASSRRLQKQYPLSVPIPGTDKVMDCSKFIVPWWVRLPIPKPEVDLYSSAPPEPSVSYVPAGSESHLLLSDRP